MRALRLLASELICLLLLAVLVIPLFLAFWALLLGAASDCIMDMCRQVQALATKVRDGRERK